MVIAVSSDAAARSSFACGVRDSDTEFPMSVSRVLKGSRERWPRYYASAAHGPSSALERWLVQSSLCGSALAPRGSDLPSRQRPRECLSSRAVEHKLKQVFHVQALPKLLPHNLN